MEPPNFPELVARILDLGLEGIERADVEIALKEHFFDVERASQFLMAKAGIRLTAAEGRRFTLSPSDRDAIARIMAAPRRPESTVLQIYVSCDGNEEHALRLAGRWRDQTDPWIATLLRCSMIVAH
jgi:hypothetical protein